MIRITAHKLIVVCLIVLTLAGGCTSTDSLETNAPTNTPAAPQDPLALATPDFTHPPQAEHQIGMRQINGVGEFFILSSGEKFVPRGVNYAFVPNGNAITTNLLQVGIYDPQRTRNDFKHLAGLGYNTVRVFLDHCAQGKGCITDFGVTGLNPDYLDNIADMMLSAREAGIYIQFTSNDLPDEGGYASEANQGSDDQFAGYRNSYYLTAPAISATRRYWGDILTGLVERDAAFDAVLGWQLLNEQWMFIDQPPLSLTNGVVETTTGLYEMSDLAEKTQMVSDGLVYYIAQMKAEILLHDPTALVTMGFFVPELVAPGWYVETASLLQNSELDYFDFHAYPGALNLGLHADAFGMRNYQAKPIIMGEYGAFRSIFHEIDSAARATTAWMAESCQIGFDGWLYWTYYSADPDIGDATWGLADEGGYLLNLFAPVNQPDPCTAVEVPNDNLAFGKPVQASRSLPDQPPDYAVDDSDITQWGAGDSPTQWIEIDLQGHHQISEIKLLVAQWPSGLTTHLVQVRSSITESFVTVYQFNGETAEGEWLVFTPETPLENVIQVRIQTSSSPSWVARKEIHISGEAIGE